MGFLHFILLICFMASTSAFAGLEAPPSRFTSYESLKFPVNLPKSEVQWMLQTIMDTSFGKSFVDMGDITDLMHGHLILRPRASFAQPVPTKFTLEQLEMLQVAQDPALEPVAILFHSHEYDNLRKGMPYIGPFGEIDSALRNQVLFLVDAGGYKRGDVVDANEFYQSTNGKKPYTINPWELPDSLFGFDINDWTYSFYFFRVTCEETDLIANQELSNLLTVNNNLLKERVCLSLMSFNCRNYPQDQKNCGGAVLKSYDIFKGWVKP